MTRSEQIADAFHAVAKANHWMVSVTERVTIDDLDEATQILITRQNEGPQSGKTFKTFELAFALMEIARASIERSDRINHTDRIEGIPV